MSVEAMKMALVKIVIKTKLKEKSGGAI